MFVAKQETNNCVQLNAGYKVYINIAAANMFDVSYNSSVEFMRVMIGFRDIYSVTTGVGLIHVTDYFIPL